MTDGTVEMMDNPSSYPDPSNIVKQEEPFVRMSTSTPPTITWALMDLCQKKRGVLIDMKYMDDVRVDLHYALPLGEIVYDFFDAIKSRSRGYASYDYEFKEYRESDLVKLDFLLNGDPVDALSMIVFRDNAYAKGRRICEKLRDNIPRNLFEIPVQAAIGGKIIARETVKAMRKDVLAKCYGGDISRKKKLLEKQKEGKKKMRQLGSVSLPSEAFTAVLKLDYLSRSVMKITYVSTSASKSSPFFQQCPVNRHCYGSSTGGRLRLYPHAELQCPSHVHQRPPLGYPV